MEMRNPVYIVASGHAHPDRELTSAELERRVPGLSEGWSEKYLGMRSRRVLDIEDRVTDLAIASVTSALDDAGWSGGDVDTIVYGSLYPDQVLPASASYVASAINRHAVAFDVRAACASFLYALSVAAAMIQAGQSKNLAVCSGEHSTAYADYTDRQSCVFWGDAAGALLLSGDSTGAPSFELVDIALNGDHEFPDRVFAHRAGHFRSDGPYSFKMVMELGSVAVCDLLERNDVDRSSVVGMAMHQASLRALEEMSVRVGIPAERQWHNVEWAGNQSAAGVLTAFSEGWKAHHDQLRHGDHVVLAAVGGGYTGGAALLRWVS